MRSSGSRGPSRGKGPMPEVSEGDLNNHHNKMQHIKDQIMFMGSLKKDALGIAVKLRERGYPVNHRKENIGSFDNSEYRDATHSLKNNVEPFKKHLEEFRQYALGLDHNSPLRSEARELHSKGKIAAEWGTQHPQDFQLNQYTQALEQNGGQPHEPRHADDLKQQIDRIDGFLNELKPANKE